MTNFNKRITHNQGNVLNCKSLSTSFVAIKYFQNKNTVWLH